MTPDGVEKFVWICILLIRLILENCRSVQRLCPGHEHVPLSKNFELPFFL